LSGDLDWYLDDMPDTLRFNNSVPLLQYLQKKKVVATANLLSDIEMPKDVDDSPKDLTYYPHLKRQIDLHVVTDSQVYPDIEVIPWQLRMHLLADSRIGTFDPIIYPSDFWHLKKHLTLLNDTSMDTLVTQQ